MWKKSFKRQALKERDVEHFRGVYDTLKAMRKTEPLYLNCCGCSASYRCPMHDGEPMREHQAPCVKHAKDMEPHGSAAMAARCVKP